jgi:hypothetical protein
MKHLALLALLVTAMLASASNYDMAVGTIRSEQEAAGRPMSTNIVVGIISTGMDTNHSDLDGIRWKGRHFDYHETTTDDAYNVNDAYGSGTCVAGLIAAEDNGSGGTGIAAGCTLAIARVHGYSDEWLAAVDWMAHEGHADVVLCWEPPLTLNPWTVRDVMETNSHILFVYPNDNDWYFYGATNAVMVGLCDTNGVNQNPWNDCVSVFAPFRTFLTTMRGGTWGYTGDGAEAWDAAASTAAVAAWLWLAYPQADIVKRALEAGTNGDGALHAPNAMNVPLCSFSTTNYTVTVTGATPQIALSNLWYTAYQILGSDTNFLQFTQGSVSRQYRAVTQINEEH